MTTLEKTQCCGIGEIRNLYHSVDSEVALISLEEDLLKGTGYTNSRLGYKTYFQYSRIAFTTLTYETHAPAFLRKWTRKQGDYGEGFVAYIKEHDLGEVQLITTFENWTDHEVKWWSWTPKYETLYAHINTLKAAALEKANGEKEKGTSTTRASEHRRADDEPTQEPDRSDRSGAGGSVEVNS